MLWITSGTKPFLYPTKRMMYRGTLLLLIHNEINTHPISRVEFCFFKSAYEYHLIIKSSGTATKWTSDRFYQLLFARSRIIFKSQLFSQHGREDLKVFRKSRNLNIYSGGSFFFHKCRFQGQEWTFNLSFLFSLHADETETKHLSGNFQEIWLLPNRRLTIMSQMTDSIILQDIDTKTIRCMFSPLFELQEIRLGQIKQTI